ncbi:MAG: ribonuclease E/G [Rhodospirillales bacterium]|nr:ribonuclease E/G [Rhodospirillales bacterium]
MAKRMLIDASHAEETRVVVADGTRLEEFDFESAARKQLKGNVYLAKVMRVEPSLQAAFVDYGGNRHGFLPFNEIHPDYYQIPVADREALYAEQEEAGDTEVPTAPPVEATEDGAGDDAPPEAADGQPGPADASEAAEAAEPENGAPEEVAAADGSDGVADGKAAEVDGPDDGNGGTNGDAGANGDVEIMGGDELDDLERRRLQASRSLLSRRYRIQEVIKKRQILLVQVVKEERGNKGAALTTYLSLAGRYIVLMPNAIRGGGISRKIVNADDRRRLKKIMADLDIPARMAVIVRTAGLSRSKTEIRRDLEYLLRRWQNIRDLTMESMAPCVINEEANLIRRSIRDLYTRDIEQILIEGDEGYKTAKTFMKTMIPSHASRVKQYRDRIPLFVRYQIESQLDSMYGPELQLKSGGYLVIDPTEALVAIDVNSGRATRERTIEETALRTNLEAAAEIARQLRLRDLAGLIVIDFIDMDESRNQRAVERKFKEAMRVDRARIRMGRISPFGLMELSRQRLRPSLVEASMERCTGCGGTGVRRSIESSAVHALRAIEEEGLQGKSAEILLRVPAAVGLYILNRKRRMLEEIEQRYAFAVSFEQDDSLVPPSYAIERIAARPAPVQEPAEEEADEAPQRESEAKKEPKGETAEPTKRRRRRRRKPRGEGAEEAAAEAAAAAAPVEPTPAEAKAEEEAEGTATAEEVKSEKGEEAPRAKRRRRGRRGGRSRTSKQQERQEEARETAGAAAEETTPPIAAEGDATPAPTPDGDPPAAPAAAAEGTATPANDADAPAPAASEAEPEAPPAPAFAPPTLAPVPEPAADDGAQATAASGNGSDDASRPEAVEVPDRRAAPPVDGGDDAPTEAAAPVLPPDDAEAEQPRRRGWWQRLASSSR